MPNANSAKIAIQLASRCAYVIQETTTLVENGETYSALAQDAGEDIRQLAELLLESLPEGQVRNPYLMNYVRFMVSALAEAGTQFQREPAMARANATAILLEDLPQIFGVRG